MENADTNPIATNARDIIESARHLRMGYLTEVEVEIIARDPEYRRTELAVKCACCRFIAAAQDVPHLVRGVERGGDGDFVREVYLPMQPGDLERMAADIAEQTADLLPGMTSEEVRDAIQRRRQKRQH